MASIYFKTKKTSETGKKFQALLDRAKAIRQEISKFCKGQGGTGSYIHTNIYALGTDVIAIEFLENPNLKIWKKNKQHKGYFAPRMNSKQGKEIYEKMCGFPKIEIEELNAIIGYQGSFIKTIGYAVGEDFFGFIIDHSWRSDTEVPNDCREITYTEYENLFLK